MLLTLSVGLFISIACSAQSQKRAAIDSVKLQSFLTKTSKSVITGDSLRKYNSTMKLQTLSVFYRKETILALAKTDQ